jgi:hypothetical protein
MATQFDPPRYTWNAATAREALEMLEAARDLIDAHLKTLAPGGTGRFEASRTASVALTVTLDLSGLVRAVNDKATVENLETALDLPADTTCWCGDEKRPGDDHTLCYPGMWRTA